MNIKSGFGLVALTAVISIAFYFTDYSITGNILAVLLIPGFNHAPVLDPIGNLTATEGFLFTQKITATDEDGNSIVFYENASFFDFTDVNSTSTLINFTPTSSMAEAELWMASWPIMAERRASRRASGNASLSSAIRAAAMSMASSAANKRSATCLATDWR